jgi:SPP1 gp7 family putative phage head morphogenesis protein
MLPQTLKELENSLNRVYLRIFKAINREDDYPDNLTAIKQKYDKIVYDNTRSAIQQAVILANEKVNRLFKTQPYLTQKDLNLIEKNTKDQVGSFWRKIILDIFRKQEQRLMGGAAIGDVEDDVSLEPPPDLDMSAYLLAVAIASLFGSYADSTLSKTTELADTIENKPRVEWRAQIDERTCDELPDSSPGCGQRNGTVYDYDDPELQIHMPGSVHPYCRCELIPII